MPDHQDNLQSLPDGLPVPTDDGACDHLVGCDLPDIDLIGADGPVNLQRATGPTIIYCYPMIGRPEVALPDNWDETPGARGCTVQSLAYDQRVEEIEALGAKVFGLSTQTAEEQAEAASRLGLRQQLLSDHDRRIITALNLPTFETSGKVYVRRLTLGIIEARVERVWYPVFPPGQDASEVVRWLANLSQAVSPPSASGEGDKI